MTTFLIILGCLFLGLMLLKTFTIFACMRKIDTTIELTSLYLKEMCIHTERNVRNISEIAKFFGKINISQGPPPDQNHPLEGEIWKEPQQNDTPPNEEDIKWVNEFIEKHDRSENPKLDENDPLNDFFKDS